MYNNLLCFTKFPNICDLLCVFATINLDNNVNVSYYNQVVLKCRQLIFEIPQVIAYPQTKQIYGIHIVLTEDLYTTGLLQKYLEKYSLRREPAQAVQKIIYEKCCSYTITSKLAPKWNQISNYFVQGRNFLTNQCLSDSVQLELSVNNKGNTTIAFIANQIKLSKMTLDKLYLTEDEHSQLTTNQFICFKENNFKIIQVLPSLKQGRIIALHLKLNKSSLKTYQEMRHYWKNTYGYRLPENDEDIFFVDVSFFDGSPIFTYPNLCVRLYEPIFSQRIDPIPIVINFIKSLKKCMPTLLGEDYPIPSYVCIPTSDVLPVTQITNWANSYAANIKIQNKKIIKSNILPNETEPKSKLSQLLQELNKIENKYPIYLTP